VNEKSPCHVVVEERKGDSTMKANRKLGFIGAGNMATAMIKGLVESAVYGTEDLLVSDKNESALRTVSERFGVKGYGSSGTLTRESGTVVFSVKPQNMQDVLSEMGRDVRDDHLLITIAAGIPIRMIRKIINRDVPIIRVMPNTPALVQMGMSALACSEVVRPEHLATAKRIFNAIGETVEVEESAMDGVTALSGSGPGYLFRIMECLVTAGVAVGLPEDTAQRLVIQTVLGAGQLAKESKESLSRLREMVTSPGGTTAAGLAVFDRMGLEEMTTKAVEAAWNRSMELGKSD
jgi:pyrroline-5-carboxylate reductase